MRRAPWLAGIALLATSLPAGQAHASGDLDMNIIPDVISEAFPEPRVRVAPRYPAAALAQGLHGTVVVGALVDTLGHVVDTRVVRSVPGLDSTAVGAVRRFEFDPIRHEGRAIKLWVSLPIRFELNAKSTQALDWEPICQNAVQRSRERGLPVPRLCALRQGDRSVFVLGPPSEAALDATTFELASSPDSCDVELLLRPAGFARGRWPCNRRTNRVVLPVGLATSSWLLSEQPVIVERVTGLDLLSGAEVKPLELWEHLFGPLPTPAPSTTPDPAPDNVVFDDETLPEVLLRVQPEYPREARERRISGTVIVKALVDREGRVAVAQIMQSIPELDEAALAAIRQWAFTPARDGDKPIAVWVAVPIKFTLK